MLTTLANYQLLITRNLDRSIETIAKRPDVQREVNYYLKHIKSIKSIDDFMKDQRIYRFALEASGLSDMIYAKAFIRKLLEEGIENPDSLANKLADPRFREFVRRYNFASYGGTATTFTRAQQGAVDDYLRLKLEAGQQDEGVRLALYFRRKAPKIKNGYAILADRALMKVAEVVMGRSLAQGDVDRNAKEIERRLPIKDFQDPEKLEKFLTRFAALWEIRGDGVTGLSGASPAAAAGIVMPGPIETGVSLGVLQALQKIKLGGF